ncbi:MAG: DUF58 domain-containing protein [Anaerolineales bacterium]|nr:DUF58 domain-containing protein [Anaerolineales bacterium]
MSTRFWILQISLFGIFLFGLMFLSGEAIALAIPLLVYLGAAMLYAPGKAQLRAKRVISADVVEQGLPVNVALTLTNDGSAVDEAYFEDVLPRELACSEGDTRKFVSLKEGETLSYEYTVHCTRGKHSFKGLMVLSSDHFGLFEQWINLASPGEFQSVPEVPRLSRIPIRPQQTRGFAGPIPARAGGSGMSFWGVREYQMGDSLRRINWKVSARNSPGLFTNQFEQERIADVGLILDARQQTNLTLGEKNLFEYSVLATAALADTFLQDGHRVSLLIYGYGMERVFPGYGKIQRQLILRALVKAEVGSNFALDSLNYLPTRLFPARSQLVMISPLGVQDYPVYARLRKDGYEVMLVSPDPVDFERQAYSDFPEVQQALRLAQLERSLLFRRLSRLGVQIVDWQVEKPFEQVIRASIGQHSFFHRNLRINVE